MYSVYDPDEETAPILHVEYTTVPEFGSGKIKWSSSDEKVVVPDEDGDFDIIGTGTAKVTVKMTKSQKIKQAKKAKTGLKVKALKGHKAKLTWKKAAGANGYYIFRATKKNGRYSKIRTIKKAGTRSWTDRKLSKGRNYYYRIRPFTKISGKTYKGKVSKPAKVRAK